MSKRCNECEGEPVASKKLKPTEEDFHSDKEEFRQKEFILLNFSDDVLLNIFKNVHPVDLVALSKTCTRLNDVCRDRTLWVSVDLRDRVVTVDELESIVPFLLPTTQKILSKGSDEISSQPLNTYTISARFIKAVNVVCPNLKQLSLECHQINASQIMLECFPSLLEHLSLKGSHLGSLLTDKSYFFGIDKLLPALKVLDVSDCLWFHPHSLLALSKSHTLKELYLSRCRYAEEYMPYASLASTFGFYSLEVLDLRGTHVRDGDVSCFNRIGSLRELYLEAPHPRSERISDVGVTSFGSEALPVINQNRMGLALILLDNPQRGAGGNNWGVRLGSCGLTTLTLRNYTAVTDISLKHAAACLPDLKRLDVRGTRCTRIGVDRFTDCRPDVVLLSDYERSNDKDMTPCVPLIKSNSSELNGIREENSQGSSNQ